MKAIDLTHKTFYLSGKLACTLGIFLIVSIGLSRVAQAEELESLAGYIQTALEQNFEIRAAQAKLDETTEMIRQAGVLPDPKLGAQYFLQPIETRTGPQEGSISLSQSIPWPGRLSLDKKLKQHDADIAASLFHATRLGVIRKIKEAYIEYGYLGQAKKITNQILELMNYLEGIVRTNYTSGNASYADVLKIQIEIEKLKNRDQSLDDHGTPVRVEINSLLGTDRNLARSRPSALPNVSLNQQEEEIYSIIRQNSPKILAAQHKVTKSRTDLDKADQGFYPDFTFSMKTIFTGEAEYGDPPDSGRDPVVAGLAVTLPIFYDRRNGAIAEKQASLRASRNDLEHIITSLDAEAEQILFRYREANRLLSLYKDTLIPKVRQELDVTLESFQAGHASILELIDTEKDWFNFELASLRAQADMAIQVARLEELTGKTLADWNQDT